MKCEIQVSGHAQRSSQRGEPPFTYPGLSRSTCRLSSQVGRIACGRHCYFECCLALETRSELELFGHKVWKALDVSEVLFLCEQHHVDAVVIAAEVDAGELIQKQWRGTVMRLKPNPDAAYLDWELSEVFPKKGSTIQ